MIGTRSAFLALMMWLTIHRLLLASGDNAGKTATYFISLFTVLGLISVAVVVAYRRLATAGRNLLTVLEVRYPGCAFPIFKTEGLHTGVDTLALALRGAVWNKRSLYAVITLDDDSIIIWDGTAKDPVIFARLAVGELRIIEKARDAVLLFIVPALTIAVSHHGVMLRVVISPAEQGRWLFLPGRNSFTALETALEAALAKSALA